MRQKRKRFAHPKGRPQIPEERQDHPDPKADPMRQDRRERKQREREQSHPVDLLKNAEQRDPLQRINGGRLMLRRKRDTEAVR